ncbi:Maleylacetoacetate isomerase Glutathione S-transferase, zeta [Candidatus Burkholderia brachyanthoides]|nr:Maleylacetoacetate isomerase Glutathione S-transferase, zeta [Candidatus Burkholderia brachyanthoides]
MNLKGLDYDYASVYLVRDGDEQLKPDYRALNPDGIVPTLVDGGAVLTQSLAIAEYLEETHPEPALLPRDQLDRAFVHSVALQIACDIHPVDNLRVLKYLKRELKVPDDVKDAWYRHWIESGFASLEMRLANDKRVGALTFGDTLTLADLYIVPQVFNAQRFSIDLTPYPTIRRIAERANQIDAFARAAPANQPDAE